MPPVTLNLCSLINDTMLEAGSLETGGVELTSPASAVWTSAACQRSHLLPIKVKCSRFGKQPCPVCQGFCHKYRFFLGAPKEKGLLIGLITTMALHLHGATHTIVSDSANLLGFKLIIICLQLQLFHCFVLFFFFFCSSQRQCYIDNAVIMLLINNNYTRLHRGVGFQAVLCHSNSDLSKLLNLLCHGTSNVVKDDNN